MVKWSFLGSLYFENTRKNFKSNPALAVVLVLESKGLYLLTDYTAIKFHTHRDPAIPRDWVYPEEASCDAFFQPVPHDYESIVIALEYLNVKERVN